MYPILECELQLFGGFCASQLVTKIGRNVFPVVHAISHIKCYRILMYPPHIISDTNYNMVAAKQA